MKNHSPDMIPAVTVAKRIHAKRWSSKDVKYNQFGTAIPWLGEADPLIEVLWFVQWFSGEPGGLRGLVAQMLAALPERFGTPTMLKIGQPRGGKYTLKEAIQIWEEIPVAHHPHELREMFWELNRLEEVEEDRLGIWRRSLSQDDDDEPRGRHPERIGRQPSSERAMLEILTPRFFRELCAEAALESGPRLLTTWLTGRDVRVNQDEPYDYKVFPYGDWMALESPLDTLREFCKLHAERERRRLADTEVSRQVIEAIDYACEKKLLVRIEGEPRVGKSWSLETWCRMYPGRGRLVHTPCTVTDREFFRAIADALGIGYEGKSTADLQEDIEFVCVNGAPGLLFDEAQWLIPSRFNPNTPPMRLDWLRSVLIDRVGLPCVLLNTPQSWGRAVRAFTSGVQYKMEQFDGRIAQTVLLPKDLSYDELIAVARLHFPNLGEDALGLCADKAEQVAGYVQAVQNIANKAEYLAGKAGKSVVDEEIFDRAVLMVYPDSEPAQEPSDPRELQGEQGSRRKAPARILKAPRRRPASSEAEPVAGSRQMTPGEALNRPADEALLTV